MTREPVLPTLRAATFTAVCLALGVAAHRLMSGTAIPAWAIALGGAGVFVPARLGAWRERGLPGITLLMGVTQVALHVLFAHAQHSAAAAAPMPGIDMPGMNGMSMPGMSMPGAGGGMRMSPAMLLGHALAALACAWWLRRGEAAVHAAVRAVARRVLDRLAVPARVAPATPAARVCDVVEPVAVALRTRWLRRTRALRGPPRTSPLA